MAILLCQNAMGISWIIVMGNFYKGSDLQEYRICCNCCLYYHSGIR